MESGKFSGRDKPWAQYFYCTGRAFGLLLKAIFLCFVFLGVGGAVSPLIFIGMILGMFPNILPAVFSWVLTLPLLILLPVHAIIALVLVVAGRSPDYTRGIYGAIDWVERNQLYNPTFDRSKRQKEQVKDQTMRKISSEPDKNQPAADRPKATPVETIIPEAVVTEGIAFQCEKCGCDVTALANADGKALELSGVATYLCPACAAQAAAAKGSEYLVLDEAEAAPGNTICRIWQRKTGRVLTWKRDLPAVAHEEKKLHRPWLSWVMAGVFVVIFSLAYPLVYGEYRFDGKKHTAILNPDRVSADRKAGGKKPLVVPIAAKAPEPTPAPPPSRDSIIQNMVPIAAGIMFLGCETGVYQCEQDDRDGRRVALPSFYIDRTEVSAGDYAQCVQAGACTPPKAMEQVEEASRNFYTYLIPGKEKQPINFVVWTQAADYCKFRGKRLPTAPEWERAARGPNNSNFPWGNEKPNCQLANMKGCSNPPRLADVDTFPEGASAEGALHLAGNLWEWTSEYYSPARYTSKNPLTPPEPGKTIEIRGGGLYSDENMLRAYRRKQIEPDKMGWDLGFRCAASFEEKK